LKTDTPTFVLPRQWGGRVWKDFLLFELLFYSPPPLSSPINGEEELRGLETDTPTLILPRQWGGRVMDEILFCVLLIYSLPPMFSLREIER
jgi:hypothetical protein